MSRIFQKKVIINLPVLATIYKARTSVLTNVSMKHSLFFLALLFMNPLSSFSQNLGTKTIEEIRAKQIENIKNPELWDMERMKTDISSINDLYPIRNGAFPVPHYKSLFGLRYRGGGSIGNHMARSLPKYRIELEDKEIGFCSFHIGDSPFYHEDNRNKTFFTLITVIDTLNAKDFAIGGSYFLSRNHPDYGGEGSFITKDDKVDFVAFTTPDKGSFAIVNMRLFHLEHGNIIIVTPQNDGSFRSLQIQGEVPTDESIFDYMRNDILKRKNVMEFFSSDKAIKN